jgi:hypothetical protein
MTIKPQRRSQSLKDPLLKNPLQFIKLQNAKPLEKRLNWKQRSWSN